MTDVDDQPARHREGVTAAAPTHDRVFLYVLVSAIVIRVAAFPFAENLWGDAPVRGDLARAWAKAPGLWWAYDRVFQFGPLPTHLGGLAIRLGLGGDVGPRLVSLIAGILGVVLVRRVAARLGGPSAGIAAGAAVALSPMHLQASTTFASEAIFIAACLWCVDRALVGDTLWMAVAAFAATTTRYDAWLFLPVLVLWIALDSADRSLKTLLWRGLKATLVLGLGPASILIANGLAHGAPLAPLQHVASEHVALAAMEVERQGALEWRLKTLLFWPTAWFVTLTPGFAIAVLWGVGLAVKQRGRALLPVSLGLLPPAIYSVRGVLGTFWPMTRFVAPAASLGACAMPPLRKRTLLTCVGIAVVFNLGLVLVGGLSGPRSPVTRLPADLRAAVAAMEEVEGAGVLLDRGPRYEHIVVAHHADHVHWRVTRKQEGKIPERIVTFRGGEVDAALKESGEMFGVRYERVGSRGRVSWWDREERTAGD